MTEKGQGMAQPKEKLAFEVPADLEVSVHLLLERLEQADWKIATAESCTGGLLSCLLTDVEGLSHSFESGFVVYSDVAKERMLGVAPALIASKDAVSAEVAEAMAKGALNRSQSDVAVAITGFAGSAGAEGKAGLVHICCASRDGAVHSAMLDEFDTGRTAVRLAATRAAIDLLLKTVPQ